MLLRRHILRREKMLWGGEDLTVSKKQQACVTRYVKKNYDRIGMTCPKGMKARIRAHAEERGESVNGFINRAINETLIRDETTDSTNKE